MYVEDYIMCTLIKMILNLLTKQLSVENTEIVTRHHQVSPTFTVAIAKIIKVTES